MIMTSESWIALAALIFAILGSSAAFIMALYTNKNEILRQMTDDKEALENDLQALRMSAYEEYKTLRKEIGDSATVARKEFGETVYAIREKMTQIELWIRDQLADTRHTLTGSMDMRHSIVIEKLEKNEDRVRKLELDAARSNAQSPRQISP